MDADRADRVADRVAEEGVLVLGVLTTWPFGGFVEDRISEPCSDSAKVVVKKNVTPSMCAGL